MRLLSLVPLLTPLSLLAAQAPQGPAAAAGTMQVRIPAATLYKEGRDVALNRVMLRRVRFAPIKKDVRIGYLKVELWFTNTDIDACTQPELGEIPDFPLSSDTSFVLVWQGGDLGKLENLHQTFLGSTVFAESWKESGKRPIVLVWSTASLKQIRELFPTEAVNLAGIVEMRYQDMTLLPQGSKTVPDSLTLAWIMNHSQWAVFHREAKNGRQDGVASSSVKVSKGAPAPMVEFFGRPRSVGISGALPPIQVCPGIVEERRHSWFDKPVKRPKP
jgi:hypothetical protein